MIATTVTSIIVLSAAMYSFSGFIVLQRLGIRLLFQQACAKCGSRFLLSLFVVYIKNGLIVITPKLKPSANDKAIKKRPFNVLTSIVKWFIGSVRNGLINTMLTIPYQCSFIRNLKPAIEFASKTIAEKNTINSFHHVILSFIARLLLFLMFHLLNIQSTESAFQGGKASPQALHPRVRTHSWLCCRSV